LSQIRIVLVGEQDMLQDIIRRALGDDPALALIAECESADEVPRVIELRPPWLASRQIASQRTAQPVL
jgi:hypothetical protein